MGFSRTRVPLQIGTSSNTLQCPITSTSLKVAERSVRPTRMASESNARVMSAFLDYLKVEKGLAPLTVSAYTTDIGQFAEFLEGHNRVLTNARRNDVRDFIQQLFSNGVDGRSVGRKLSALRHLYRHLLIDAKIEHDPTLNIDSPRQWKVLPKALARDEMEKTLAGPPPKDTKLGQAIAARDRSMLEVFYAGALRVSEIVNAKLEDLKLETGYMLVRGKGDKERIVPLGKSAQDALAEYLKTPRATLTSGKSSPYLFLARIAGVRALGVTAHAASLLCHTHGRKRSRPAHRADDPRPLRHLDHAGVHAPGTGPFEDRVPEASSASEGEAVIRHEKPIHHRDTDAQRKTNYSLSALSLQRIRVTRKKRIAFLCVSVTLW